MKRFIIFGFYNHYPYGGMSDAFAAADTLDDAMAYIREHKLSPYPKDKYEILDTFTVTAYNEDGVACSLKFSD